MKKNLYILIIGMLLFPVVLVACNRNANPTFDKIKRTNLSPARIRLGAPDKYDINAPGGATNTFPSDSEFYQHNWMNGSLGNVEFMHGKHSFFIDDVAFIQGIAEKNVPGGIYEWDINFGVSAGQTDTDEAALARMMKLFSDLRARGWVHYVDADHPRLTGKQAWDYMAKDHGYSLDPGYTPTIDEWKTAAKRPPGWIFYANGVYLAVYFTQTHIGGSVGKNIYLLSIAAMNEYAFYGLKYFSGDAEKLRDWKALLPAKLRKCHAKRLAIEAALEAQGYVIDRTYQDPPVKALRGSPAKALSSAGAPLPGKDYEVATQSGAHISAPDAQGRSSGLNMAEQNTSDSQLQWDEFLAPSDPCDM